MEGVNWLIRGDLGVFSALYLLVKKVSITVALVQEEGDVLCSCLRSVFRRRSCVFSPGDSAVEGIGVCKRG